MRKVFLFAGALMLPLSFISCERIVAGCEGILVNLYGSERGVDDVSMVTGRVFHNPATQEVYEYPTYVQTIDYEPFTINAKDGSEFKVDPNINLKVKDGPKVFRKYRKELTDVINGPVFKYVKDACRIEINKFTTDQIVSNREAVEQAIEKRLSKLLDKEGFVLDQFTSGLQYPKTIVDGVRTKIQKEGVRKQYWMHNMIMSKTDENNVINHNTLDNRKSNLRELSKKDNATNTSVDKKQNWNKKCYY